jgi:hypothetical protein
MRLAEGEDEGETWSFAISPKSSLIAATDAAGRVSLRGEATGRQTRKPAEYQGYAT